MKKVVQVHLLGPRLSGRVVRAYQLTASKVREIGNQALELAPDDVTGLQLRMLELQCAMPQFVHSVTRLPVTVWEPPAPLKENASKAEREKHAKLEASRPKDDHEVRAGAIVITKKGDDGLGNLQDGDWVLLTAQELEMEGPKSWDNVFDSPETQLLERLYGHLHDAPPQAVIEMLSGKARPVLLEG